MGEFDESHPRKRGASLSSISSEELFTGVIRDPPSLKRQVTYSDVPPIIQEIGHSDEVFDMLMDLEIPFEILHEYCPRGKCQPVGGRRIVYRTSKGLKEYHTEFWREYTDLTISIFINKERVDTIVEDYHKIGCQWILDHKLDRVYSLKLGKVYIAVPPDDPEEIKTSVYVPFYGECPMKLVEIHFSNLKKGENCESFLTIDYEGAVVSQKWVGERKDDDLYVTLEAEYGRILTRFSGYFSYSSFSFKFIDPEGDLVYVPVMGKLYICVPHLVGGAPQFPELVLQLISSLAEEFIVQAWHGETFQLIVGDFNIRFTSGVLISKVVQAIKRITNNVSFKINNKVIQGDEILTHDDVVTLHPLGVGGKKSMMQNKPQKKKNEPTKVKTLIKAMTKMAVIPKTTKKKKVVKKENVTSSKTDSNFTEWKKMIRDPTAEFAARLPGDHRLKTDIVQKTINYSLSTNTGATQGYMGFILGANPAWSFIDLVQWAGGSSMVTATSGQKYSANPWAYETYGGLGSLLQNGRLTGCGFRLASTAVTTAVVGKGVFASIPNMKKNFGFNAFNSQAIPYATSTQAGQQLCGGYNPGIISTASLINIPGGHKFELEDIVYDELILRPYMISNDCYTFKNVAISNTTYNSTYDMSTDTLYSTTTGLSSVNYSDNPDIGTFGLGWVDFAVFCSEVSLSVAPFMEITCRYVIEGQPNINVTSDSFVPVTNTGPTGYEPTLIDLAMQFSNSMPYWDLVQGAARFGLQLARSARKR